MQYPNMEQPLMMVPQGIPLMSKAGIMMKSPSTEATLYVGNLSPKTQDSELFAYFRPFGEILTCRIMRDIYSGVSRGFGFVSFSKVEDAINAKEALNYSIIEDREIRICFKKNTKEFVPEANIFIKNIDKDFTNKELDQLCSQYGNILSCIIRSDSEGKSLGYGYVQYPDKEAALKALEALNGKKIRNQEIVVSLFVGQKNRNLEKKNLYMKCFPIKWDKERIQKFIKTELGALGEISSSDVMECKKDEAIKYFAFVCYEDEKSAKQAVDKFQNKKLEEGENEEEFYITYAQSKKERKEQFKNKAENLTTRTDLLIKSLKEDVTQEKLKEVFSKFGEITSVYITKTSKKPKYVEKHLKFGFVCFKKVTDASNAIFNANEDEDIKALIDSSHPSEKPFIHFKQSQKIRSQYLAMKRTNFRSLKNSILNPLMMNMNKNAPMPFGMNFNIDKQPNMEGSYTQNSNSNYIPTPTQGHSTPISNPNQTSFKIDVNWLKSNPKEFEEFSRDKKRNVLGELMFKQVSGQGINDPHKVSKITGMLIDLDILEIEEIIDILENQESLKDRIQEALEVIEESNQI